MEKKEEAKVYFTSCPKLFESPQNQHKLKATEDQTQVQENKNQENQAVENQNNQSATSFLTYFMILLFAMLAGMSWISNRLL